VIEEGFSHLNWLAQSARSRARDGGASGEPGQDFTPAPPADVRRGSRRMPEVDDFPPIMQREYRAKVGEPQSRGPAAGFVADGRTRMGLLQRIMGRARGLDDHDSESQPEQEYVPDENESLATLEDETWWEDDVNEESDPSADHPNGVPAIFNRLRK
jgi:cell division protein FtsZ